jgi:bifunctional non-homologous end joining protein LigD
MLGVEGVELLSSYSIYKLLQTISNILLPAKSCRGAIGERTRRRWRSEGNLHLDKPYERSGRRDTALVLARPRKRYWRAVVAFRSDGYIPPCIPTRAYKVPAGPDWVHEIKHDGYRLQVRRDGDTVRLFTRRGYDWSGRYPAIAVTAMQLRARSFTLDGEACVCGPDGVAIFDALHRRGTVSEAMLYAFDFLELDGEDLRALPLGDRKKRMATLLARRRIGIVLSTHTAEDGASIFQQACRMGLEGIVSKRLSAPYRSGPSRDWLKVKNPDSPAMIRARDAEW